MSSDRYVWAWRERKIAKEPILHVDLHVKTNDKILKFEGFTFKHNPKKHWSDSFG
jgi:hypothetical protein